MQIFHFIAVILASFRLIILLSEESTYFFLFLSCDELPSLSIWLYLLYCIWIVSDYKSVSLNISIYFGKKNWWFSIIHQNILGQGAVKFFLMKNTHPRRGEDLRGTYMFNSIDFLNSSNTKCFIIFVEFYVNMICSFFRI